MDFAERLEKYRTVLKALSECDADLNVRGFTKDRDSDRLQRWIEDERIRIERAMSNFPAPTLPAVVRRSGT